MTSSIQTAADDLRRQLAEKVEAIKSLPAMAEVLKLQQALNALEDVLGAQRTSLSEVFGLDAGVNVPIRSDEFYGLSALDAAKKYLKKRGEARPLKEIIEAVRSGGGQPGSETDLRESLSRSTYQIAKVGADLYGLVEFYPNLKRGKKKKGVEEAGSTSSEAPALTEPIENNSDDGDSK